MKFCPYCGTQIPDDSRKFCEVCGSDVSGVQPSQLCANTYAPPQPAPKPLGMKWFKFNIYFALFLSALSALWTSISYVTGIQYLADEVTAAEVYEFFGGMWYLDVIFGILYALVAVYCIFTRFALAGYKTYGPKCFISIYIINTVLNVGYAVGEQWVLMMSPHIDDASGVLYLISGGAVLIPTIAGCVLMVCLNYVYFKNRKHLFVN